MQYIVRQEGAFQIFPLHWINNVPTEISLTATYYYIGIFVIRSGGQSLVRPLTGFGYKIVSANEVYKRRPAEDNAFLAKRTDTYESEVYHLSGYYSLMILVHLWTV